MECASEPSNQRPKLLCSEINPCICLENMPSPRLLLAYAREKESNVSSFLSYGTPLMADFGLKTP